MAVEVVRAIDSPARKFPVPKNEQQRLEALARYRVIETPPEQAFDELTRLASHICGTPIALVSLVEAERQWFKASLGLPGTETVREVSFCTHALLSTDDLLVVPDATLDDRFSAFPTVVQAPHVRFYAGAPIVSPDGFALGTICVMDTVPRELNPEQLDALRILSRQAMSQLQLREQMAAVEDARAQLLSALDRVPTSLMILGAPDGHVVLRNQAARDMLGGQGLPDVCLNDGTAVPPQEWATSRALRGETVEGQQLLLTRADGQQAPILLSAAPVVSTGGRVIGSVVSFQDISELSEVARLKDEFVATVSHELRTPLTSIKGALQLLLDDGSDRHEDEATLLEVALSNAERLIRMVNDMLDLAKIEAGQFTLACRPCDTAAIIEESVASVRPQARELRVAIETQLAADMPRLYVDCDRIIQAVVNLLSNAMKFAPQDSTVLVSAKALQAPARVEFSVSDQGSGIPAAKLALLFQKFAQLHTGGPAQRRGTGLGLAITRAIVEQHQGQVHVVESSPAGTTFRIVLPIVIPE